MTHRAEDRPALLWSGPERYPSEMQLPLHLAGTIRNELARADRQIPPPTPLFPGSPTR